MIELDDILRTMKTQKEWDADKRKYIESIELKYKGELEDYIPIYDKKSYNFIKIGGYVRYVNSMDEIKWGGILLKKFKENDIDYMILSNSNNKFIKVSFYRNTIFYKKHTTASDKNRKLFISYLDKNPDL